MSSHNLGLLYYRYYYDPEEWDFNEGCEKTLPERDRRDSKKKEKNQEDYFARKNSILENTMLSDQVVESIRGPYAELPEMNDPGFQLRTIYPGMLLGSGYAHGIGDVLGEHKIGFYFDHTLGLPVIPGSSVKGVLRSAFPEQFSSEDNKSSRRGYIRYLLCESDIADIKKTEADDEFIDRLEQEIFDGIIFDEKKVKYHVPMPYRDVFHDAYLSGPTRISILGSDYITPHNKPGENGTPAELRNPIPIQFLKIMPGIDVFYQFRLYGRIFYQNRHEDLIVYQPLLSPDEKRKLFKAILLDFGVGAKTNVGYGQFVDPEAPSHLPSSPDYRPPLPQHQDLDVNRLVDQEPGQRRNQPRAEVQDAPSREKETAPPKKAKPFDPEKHKITVDKLKKDKEILAKVLKVEAKAVEIELIVEGLDPNLSKLKVPFFRREKPSVGKWCWVKIKQVNGRPPKIKEILPYTNKITIIENQ